ncbi:hypothetical protein GQ54DRAFT_314117, partial [Martensiomyces pterosporus]
MRQTTAATPTTTSSRQPGASNEKSEPPPAQTSEQALPYCPFSAKARAVIVLITALTALVSPLSANMYYPSIQKVRDDLHTTQSA